MANLTADVRLLDESYTGQLQRVHQLLYGGHYMFYINVSHFCSRPMDPFWSLPHVKVVVYDNLFYEDLLAMVLGYNAGLSEEDIDIDSHPVGIGYCICGVQTQT